MADQILSPDPGQDQFPPETPVPPENQPLSEARSPLESQVLPEGQTAPTDVIEPVAPLETPPPFPDQFGGLPPAGVDEPGVQPPPPPPPDEYLPTSPLGGIFERLKTLLPVLLALLLVAVLVFVGQRLWQSRRGVGGPGGGTITYWGLWEPAGVMEAIIADYQKDNPRVEIEYVQESPQDYRERLQSAFARGEGPDIFRFHHTWVPMLKGELTILPKEIISEEDYYPVVTQTLKQDQGFYGVPLMMDTLAMFVNDDIFRAAGKTPPTTWEEFQQAALELTVKDSQGQIQTAGAALGTTSNVDHWPDILGLMMVQNGVDMKTVDSTIGADGRNLGADALTFYTMFSRAYRVWDETLPGSTLSFAGGKLAMYFGPSWRVLNIQQANPDLNFRVLPVPQLPGTRVAWASFWAEGVWNKSPVKDEAIKFLQYLSSPEVLQKLYQNQSATRLFGELYPRVEMANLLSNNPLVAPFLSQAPYAQSWYLCSRTFDNGINDRMIKYFEDAVNAVNQGSDAAAALKTAAQGATQLLNQYGVE